MLFESLPKPQDGLVSRAELRAPLGQSDKSLGGFRFASNCRAAWSDWELDKAFFIFILSF